MDTKVHHSLFALALHLNFQFAAALIDVYKRQVDEQRDQLFGELIRTIVVGAAGDVCILYTSSSAGRASA